MSKSLYEILEVESTASLEEIKAAYKRLALQYHPDKANEEHRLKVQEKMKDINNAYGTLSDPDKKRHYDDLSKLKPTTSNFQFDFGSFFKTNFEHFHQSPSKSKKTSDKQKSKKIFPSHTIEQELKDILDKDNVISLNDYLIKHNEEDLPENILYHACKLGKLEISRGSCKILTLTVFKFLRAAHFSIF
jgi:DnaJ-class molecular chaperone